MTVVAGKIESLIKLKETLNTRGIYRFNSIGEINRFLKEYDTEKSQLLSQIEKTVYEEIEGIQSLLAVQQQAYNELKDEIRDELNQKIRDIEVEIKQVSEKGKRSIFLRVFYYFKVKSLSRQKSSLENNLENILNKKAKDAKTKVVRLQNEVEDFLKNKEAIISRRYKKSLDDLVYTKKVIDDLYPLIAGAIGENSVVNELQKLSDNYYLINDFFLKFNPPIYNKRDGDRIFSIQIDHILICQAGVFVLETKNWSAHSVENMELRSPVKQIQRTSYALFVLLNSKANVGIGRHHWGVRKIPIRSIVVMTNKSPKEEFKFVKVLPLNGLKGYLQYFDEMFTESETENIFNYLNNKVN